MNDPQVPTTKPLFLKTPINTTSSIRPSSALQGATLAFLPKPPVPTVRLSPASPAPPSAGARSAALAAGTRSYRLSPSGQDQRQDETADRGRLSQSTRDSINRSITTTAARLTTSEKPKLQRSASAIAARHATSQSRSPRRSPNRSPQRHLIESYKPGNSESPSNVAEALSGALASMASSPSQQAVVSSLPPVRNRILDFERIPELSAPVERPALGHSETRGMQEHVYTAGSVTQRRRQSEDTDLINRGRSPSHGETTIHSQVVRGPLDTSTSTMHSHYNTGKVSPPIAGTQRPAMSVRRSNRNHNLDLHSNTPSPGDLRDIAVSNLADAMVASSLASSRAVSPNKNRSPVRPRRRSKSISAMQDLVSNYELDKPARLPKPPRPMKHTLRKPSSASDDEDPGLVKRGRRHWMRKHPNMHHEGDRKRWRDVVTEAERRRYEGVFAANRGLHIGPGYFSPSPSALSDLTAEGNKVVNVVVKDIWERSRLPRDILMEVYDLVSPEQEKSLGRDQFVVGMWLIDQRLKGRKLPVKVSSTVWTSVRHPDGIKLKNRAK